MDVLRPPAATAGMRGAAAAAHAEPRSAAVLAVSPPVGDACSLASTGAELEQQQRCLDAMDPMLRTHHLLKHCLSQSQRGAALAHFHTGDPREAAKEIVRMGQRELQAKFKEVYGSATKSNNNSWLRRKLYEAVGVAPLKANTKGKTRKGASHSSHSRKSSKDSGSKASRSPKLAAVKVKREAPCASPPHLPSAGPLSILDLHQHSGLLSNDTSDSEDGEACASRSTFPQATRQSSPSTPCSPLVALGGVYGTQQRLAPSLHAPRQQRACPLVPAPAGFVPVEEPQSPLGAGLHWADGLPAVSQQLSGAAFVGPANQALPALGDDLAAFKPMDLEQECASLWETEAQPWYFGSGMDLSNLALPKPMLCGGGMPPSCDDDDDIPLLTLDLGAIRDDVSI